jgi:hypothetical protein
MTARTRSKKKAPSTDETRLHVLAAGHELLAAAKGALNFCLSYAEQAMPGAPHLTAFFKKAITVAEELSAGLLDKEGMKKAVKTAMPPLFAIMEMEMCQKQKKKHTTAKRPATKRAPARRKKRTTKKKSSK